MGVGGQSHAPAALLQGKSSYPLYRRLGGPHSRSGTVRKISPPPGFDRRTVQPVDSRYTDYAIAGRSKILQRMTIWKYCILNLSIGFCKTSLHLGLTKYIIGLILFSIISHYTLSFSVKSWSSENIEFPIFVRCNTNLKGSIFYFGPES